MPNQIHKLKQAWTVLGPFLFGWLLLLSSHWLAIGLAEENPLFHRWDNLLERLPPLLLVLALMIASSVWLYRHRHRYFPVRTLSRRPANERAYSTLILIVSPPKPAPTFPVGQFFPPTVQGITLRGIPLHEDIELLNGTRWNWQQLLRVFNDLKDRDRLRHIYLIGSQDRKEGAFVCQGSYQWLDQCQGLLQHYLPNTVIDKFQTPVDFEDLAALMEAIQSLLHQEKQQNVPEREIIIDVTGGQKTASIAAALVTLHSKLTFQYVQTYPPYQVIAYDVVTESYFSLSE